MVLGMIILDAALCILRDERIEMHARKDTCSAIITRRFTRCFQGQTLKKTKLGLSRRFCLLFFWVTDTHGPQLKEPCPTLISTRQPRGSIMDKDKRNNIFFSRHTVGGCCIILPGNKHYKIDFFLLVTC